MFELLRGLFVMADVDKDRALREHVLYLLRGGGASEPSRVSKESGA
jgi:hypothetical protein